MRKELIEKFIEGDKVSIEVCPMVAEMAKKMEWIMSKSQNFSDLESISVADMFNSATYQMQDASTEMNFSPAEAPFALMCGCVYAAMGCLEVEFEQQGRVAAITHPDYPETKFE